MTPYVYPIKRYHCIQTSYYQLKMIILTFTMSLLRCVSKWLWLANKTQTGSLIGRYDGQITDNFETLLKRFTTILSFWNRFGRISQSNWGRFSLHSDWLTNQILLETLFKCVGHSQMSKADHIMHFCWCIYVLIFFYVLPTLVSISSSCFLWCKVKPYDFGTVINSSDSVNDRVGLPNSLRSRSRTTSNCYISDKS